MGSFLRVGSYATKWAFTETPFLGASFELLKHLSRYSLDACFAVSVIIHLPR